MLPAPVLPTLALLVAACLAAACSGVGSDAPAPRTEQGPIRLALPTTSTPEAVVAHGGPLASLVERQTGLRVTLTVPTSPETAVGALGAGSLDAAWLTPFAYVVARDRWGADVLLGSARTGSVAQPVRITVPGEHGRPTLKELAGPIPRDAFAVRPTLLPSTREALRGGLLGAAATDEGRRLLGGLLGADGLVPLTDADFEPVRQAARALELGPERLLAIGVSGPE